ncbi:MAG: KH domain-containing protein [Candidatus Nanohaloarchaeota archaeon QJJ-9]|nr:KH domain-containing protein [Candidatus Nanohaloarchaeota archaeon QJJ-9]
MQTPLCSICLESDDILCTGCKQKLEDGEITEKGVEVSRFLFQLSQDIPTLEDVEIKEVRDVEDAVVIITAEGDGPRVVGKNGEVVKKLADYFDQSIRVVEATENPEEVIRTLLTPVEVESINTVYKPEGTEKKVVVSEDDENRVPLSKDDFKIIVDDITGNTYRLSFE